MSLITRGQLHLQIIFIFCAQVVLAQDKVSPALLAHFNIRAIEGYVFESETGQDSFLITRDSINAKGRKTKVEIHDRKGMRCEYIYTYRDDTVCTKRVTRCNGHLVSETEFLYDDQNREIRTNDYNEQTSMIGNFSITQYNERKRTKEVKIYFSNQLSIEEVTLYNQDHEPIEISRRKNGKWEHTRLKNGMSPDIKMEENENYNGTGLNLTRKIMIIDAGKTILGLSGEIKLVPGDILMNEEYRDKDGLIEYEIQFLNHIFVAKKKYKYISS